MIALPGGDQLQRRMLDAAPIDDLALLLELLAAGAVQPLVLGDVQVVGTGALDPEQQLGDRAGVAGLGGADPVIVAAIQSAPELSKAIGHPIDPELGGN